MQGTELDIGQSDAPARASWLERLSLLDKAPFAFGCGCLLGLSSPGFDIWWLAWIGLVPLLVLLRSSRTIPEAATLGLAFGFGYELVSLRWLLGLYPLRWMGMSDWLGFQSAAFVWLLESLHQALLFAAFSIFVYALPMRAGGLPLYRRPFFPYLISVPLLWVFFQWVVATSEAFLGVPVNQLAYSQAGQLEIIQLAKWGGSQAVDFLLVASNAVIASIFIEMSGLVTPLPGRADRMSAKSGLALDFALLSIIVISVLVWGEQEMMRVAAVTDKSRNETILTNTPPISVAVAQGNVALEEERLGSLTSPEIARRYSTLVHGVASAVAVLPEGVISSAQRGPGGLLQQLQQIAQIEKRQILAGSIDQTDRGVVNGVTLIGSTVAVKDSHYAKRRLVPFGEYLPGGPITALVPAGIQKLLVGSDGFIPAPSLTLLGSLWGKVGTSVCVEVIYPRLIAEEVRNGAALLINVSNLAWFHNSTLNKQILAAAVMRAVENGRYMVLSTNTGISAIIDPAGIVSSESLPGKKGVILDTVQFLYRKTPFTQMWWL